MKLSKASRRRRYPLLNPGKVNVPRNIEVAIFLIVHELKSRMVYEALSQIATIDCYLESHLDRLILKTLRMWDGTDETYNYYFALMDKWSREVNTDNDVITRRALKIHGALISFRDTRKQQAK
jgi:hypothetical protein